MKTANIIYLLLLVGINAPALRAQKSISPAESSGLLDYKHPEEVINTVKAAAPNDKPDILFAAMHNASLGVQEYCFKQLPTLERVQRAHLIAKIIMDLKLIIPAEWLQGGAGIQGPRQAALLPIIYDIFGEQPPKPYLETYPEAKALAARLNAVH